MVVTWFSHLMIFTSWFFLLLHHLFISLGFEKVITPTITSLVSHFHLVFRFLGQWICIDSQGVEFVYTFEEWTFIGCLSFYVIWQGWFFLEMVWRWAWSISTIVIYIPHCHLIVTNLRWMTPLNLPQHPPMVCVLISLTCHFSHSHRFLILLPIASSIEGSFQWDGHWRLEARPPSR